jgi:hypothetical protein
MPPVFGFLLYFVATVFVSVIAVKRGQPWWPYALSCVVLGPMLAMVVAQIGGSVMAGFSAFLIPLGAIFLAFSYNTAERDAVLTGDSGEYKKCPFCAEAVRKEAIKCRHCGSSIGPTPTPSS